LRLLSPKWHNISTYNRFACLSQEGLVNNDENIHGDTRSYTQHPSRPDTYLHDIRRHKRFAHDSRTGTEQMEQEKLPETAHNTRERKPPLIYLTSRVKSYTQFAQTLKESVGENFHLKFLGEKIKIQFNKVKDFVDFKKFAIEMKHTFHTYSLPEEKSITVVLKSLPNIPNLSIQEELLKSGITINTCTQINNEKSLYATYKINLSAQYTLTQDSFSILLESLLG